ncbi:MAG TPA: hypothetical protein VFR46_12030 [Actinomycetes bacterium]|nr:hypothetical protein [Actinomycetes bacterium]
MSVVQRLMQSAEPAIRLQVACDPLGKLPDHDDVRTLREQVRTGARVATLLRERDAAGRIQHHPYSAKWYGAHWVLVALAELFYPAGDESLVALRDQMMGWLFSDDYLRRTGRVHGLPTLHASIDGNAVWSALSLGIPGERTEQLVQRLLDTQWPDGGWNCDRRATGRSSSFTESLIPLRALALHAQVTGDDRSRRAAERASEFFLVHRLFRRRHDGRVIAPSYLQLHYPCYWHYDILFGLEVLAEAGHLQDSRCAEALDVLRAKTLPDGGFPAEHRYYQCGPRATGQRSLVDWGPTSVRRMNEWVTARALKVLQ